MADCSFSSRFIPGWKSGSISAGDDSAMAPIGARLEPRRMKDATRTSNGAAIALAALAATSTPSGVMPSNKQWVYPRATSCWPSNAPAPDLVG